MSEKPKEKTPAEEKYADIIGCERPQDPEILGRHPKMDVGERAKVFSPFAALRGHSERLEEETEKLKRTTQAELSEEEKDRLNGILSSLQKGQELTVLYFTPEDTEEETGILSTVTGTVTGIDPVGEFLTVEGVPIPFSYLFDLIPLPPGTENVQ